MISPRSWLHTSLIALSALIVGAGPLVAQSSPGETKVAQWKDDKKAAFLLMFDDGWPSHWQVALPALTERQMIATFYICPDKGEFSKFESTWQEDMQAAGMVMANHTMTHQGVQDMDNAEYEIGECSRFIRVMAKVPDTKLISYGQPGVGPGKWNITGEELDALLKKYNLVSRPDFKGHGAVYHLKTTEEMLALADKAISEGGMEYLVIHGLERIEPDWGYQDFWPLPQDVFLPLLDGLKERRDRGDLWITDHISQHQYQTERESAEAKLIFAKPEGFRVELKSAADKTLYDYPLTLLTRVPPSWKSAEIMQGEKLLKVPVENGLIRYDAVPNGPFIDIREGK